MSRTSGRQLGPYVVGERTGASESGEWFAASEATLDRPVLMLLAPLPPDDAAADEMRRHARRLTAVSDARLLPVYAQGEDEGAIWLTTRYVAGRSLRDVGRLDRERAARIGSQVARQLAALREAGVAPDGMTVDDVVVEGAGEQERAWLLPNPSRPGGDDASSATQSLVELLETHMGRPLLDEPASDPQALAEQFAPLFGERRSRGRYLLVGIAVAGLATLALVAAAILMRDSGSSDSNAPPARVAARISLGEPASNLAASDDTIWATTPGGALIRVDSDAESVVGAPLKLFPKESYVDLVVDEGAVWAGGPGLLVRVDSSTGRILERKRLGSRAVSGVLPTDETLWVTVNDGPSPMANLVKFDRKTGREVGIGVAGGFAIPTMAIGDTVWALGGDASLRRLAAGRGSTTIGLGNQAGFPAEHDRKIWIPTRIDRTIVAVNPLTMSVEHTLRFDGEPVVATAGADSVWVLTRSPSRVHRIDPEKGVFVGRPLAAPEGANLLEFGDGSLWIDDPNTKSLVRLTPTTPAPAARPVAPPDRVLRNGPIPKNVRLRVTSVKPHFSIQVPTDAWLAQAISPGTGGNLELFRYRRPGPDTVGVSFAATSQAFGRSQRLVPLRTPDEFLKLLRESPSIRIESVNPATLANRPGLKVRFRTVPKPPFPETCRGNPCVLLFPQPRGTFVLLPGTEEFTIVEQGRGVFMVDASFGNRKDPRIARQVDALLESIRFEK